MALRSTQHVTEMRTRSFPGGEGKCGRRAELRTLPPSYAFVKNAGSFNLLEPSGSIWACIGIVLPLPILGITLKFTVLYRVTDNLGNVLFFFYYGLLFGF